MNPLIGDTVEIVDDRSMPMRTETDTLRQERVDAMLREMFAVLSAQPISNRLMSVLDQMDDSPALEQPLRRSRA
jgi:hypothetical protein